MTLPSRRRDAMVQGCAVEHGRTNARHSARAIRSSIALFRIPWYLSDRSLGSALRIPRAVNQLQYRADDRLRTIPMERMIEGIDLAVAAPQLPPRWRWREAAEAGPAKRKRRKPKKREPKNRSLVFHPMELTPQRVARLARSGRIPSSRAPFRASDSLIMSAT